MSSSDMLLTIAELAVALAGFSGVVVGIRGTRTGSLSRQDRLGLMNILASSGGALAFSLLPLALAATGVGEAASWMTTSVLLGAIVTGVSLRLGLLARTAGPRHPLVFWFFILTGGVLGPALLAGALGLLAYPASLLPLVLLWLLLAGFSQFVTFLVLEWLPDEAPPPDAG